MPLVQRNRFTTEVTTMKLLASSIHLLHPYDTIHSVQSHHWLHGLHVPAVTSSCQATQLLRNGSELVCRCSDFLLLGLQCGNCLRLLLRQLQ